MTVQFAVTALDYTDPEALDRRMQHREAHLASVRELIREGRFLSGGAILDEDGKMIGSHLHLEFPDRESLEEHLQSDPYIAGRVWEHIEIRPVKLVPLR